MLLYMSQSNTFSSIIELFQSIYLSTFAIGRCLPSFSLEYVLFNCLKNPFTDPRILSLSGHTITQAISLGGSIYLPYLSTYLYYQSNHPYINLSIHETYQPNNLFTVVLMSLTYCLSVCLVFLCACLSICLYLQGGQKKSL